MENTTQVIGEDENNEHNHNYTDDEGSASASGEYSGEELFVEGFSAEFDTFPIVLACLIVAINLTVIILFIRNRSLKTVTNSFLVSLAASDLLAGMVGIPLTISCSVFRDNNFCPPAQLIWRFISVSTVLHILLVSVDRYIAIKYAMRYHNIVTRKVFCALTTLAWTSAAFVSLIQLSWRTNARMNEGEDEHLNKAQIIYDLTIFGLFFAVPLFVMAFTYCRIFITVRYHERQICRYHSPSDTEQALSHNSAQRKTATIFLTMLIVFIVCWLPYFILSFQEEFGHYESPPVWVVYVFYYHTRFFTSLSNPLLYVLGKRDFREALTQAICKKNRTRNESRASTTLTALYGMEQGNSADARSDLSR